MQRNKRSVLIIFLLVAVLAITGVYATFAHPLAQNSVRTVANSWEIGFTSATTSEVRGNAKEITPVDYTKNSAVFNVHLNGEGDQITYNFTIKNMGALDAKVDGIHVLPANDPNDVIKFEVSGLKTGDILNVGESVEMKVTASFNAKGTNEAEKSATVVVNYVQK